MKAELSFNTGSKRHGESEAFTLTLQGTEQNIRGVWGSVVQDDLVNLPQLQLQVNCPQPPIRQGTYAKHTR